MKKTLIEVGNLDTYICQSSKQLCVDNSMLLTPGAKDELHKRGITIVYGQAPSEHVETCQNSSVERLMCAVTSILKNQYNITDPEELKKLTCQIMQTIKENL